MLRGPDARLRLIVTLLIAVLLPIIGQLVRLQVLEHAQHKAEAQELVERRYALPDPPWGCITDRNGDLLVGNIPVYNIGAEIGLLRSDMAREEAARALAPLLNRPETAILADLTLRPEEEGRQYVWRPLAYSLSAEASQSVTLTRYSWITIAPTWQRHYPEGALAAHTLGFVNSNGEGYGVQAAQVRFLQGQRVENIGEVGVDSNPLPDEMASSQGLPYPGADLRLTLDRTLQAFVEGELDRALQEYNAPSGTIIVLDTRTGDILALASRPTYEPWRFAEVAAAGEERIFLDPNISIAYEPGSVFKLITVAAALDSGRATLDWSYQDQGRLEYGGIIIRNWDGNSYGQQGLQGVISHSLNVGAGRLSAHVLGGDLFYHYVRAFGFGQPTGVEVRGESAGLVHMPSDWDWADSYLVTNSFGQGIAVTPLQMATAIGALANGGLMMQPHIVAERYYPDGRHVTISPRPLGQPVSAETARAMTGLMVRAVEHELTQAVVPGYRIAGKSSTAQIPGPGGYDPNDVIASFIGYGPVPDPQILVLVNIDRPQVPRHQRWGSQLAAPVFQRIIARSFVLLGIPPDNFAAAP